MPRRLRARCRRSTTRDKIKEPILLIHGEADDNAGTFPIQSERFYMALKGHGATVRYVTLPYEGARLRRARVRAAHHGGDAELGERVGEERQAPDDELAAAVKCSRSPLAAR